MLSVLRRKGRGSASDGNGPETMDRAGGIARKAGGGWAKRAIFHAMLVPVLYTLAGSISAIDLQGPNGLNTVIENWGLDMLFSWRGPIEAPKDIVVVTVDVDSFKRLGLQTIYPFPRSRYAEALHILKDADAEAVVFDIAFSESSLDSLEDDKLAEALGILPTFIPDDSLGALQLGAITRHRVDLTPLKKFSDQVKGVGGIGTILDGMDKVRYFPIGVKGKVSLVAKVAQSLRQVPMIGQDEDDPEFFNTYINYYGTPYPFQHVSIADVLEHKVPGEFFKSKIVLIGPDLIFENINGEPQGKDLVVAPDGTWILGVMVEATALANLIHKEFISRIPADFEYQILNVSFFCVIFVLLVSPPHYVVYIAVLTTIIAGSIAYILFLNLIFIPWVFLILVTWGYTVFRSLEFYVWEQKKKALLAQQFGCYLDPSIVRQIVTSGQAPDLGGRLIGCALMFTDIIGFTTYSESRSALDVGDFLNGYFTRIQGSILSQKGTLLSMLGDGLFALWGAPVAVTNECDQALSAAKGIQDGELDSSSLRTRIGLHYGEVLVGHFGSRERYDYSAIGDEVNLASRIEGLNKLFGTHILMSKAFVSRLSSIDLMLYLGQVQVAGFSKPVGVYTIDQYGIKVEWEKGVRYFEEGQFDAALELFNSLNVSHPFSMRLTSPYIEAIKRGEGKRYLVAPTK